MYQPSRTPFLMLHLWWHHCNLELYSSVLPDCRPLLRPGTFPEGLVNHARKQCFAHALFTADIFSTALELEPQILITGPGLAICSYRTSQLLCWLAEFFVGFDPSDLIPRLRSCAQILAEQSKLFVTTQIIQRRSFELVNAIEMAAEDRQRAKYVNCPGCFIFHCGCFANLPGPCSSTENRSLGMSLPRDLGFARYSTMFEVNELKFTTATNSSLDDTLDDGENEQLQSRSPNLQAPLRAMEATMTSLQTADMEPQLSSQDSHGLKINLEWLDAGIQDNIAWTRLGEVPAEIPADPLLDPRAITREPAPSYDPCGTMFATFNPGEWSMWLV